MPPLSRNAAAASSSMSMTTPIAAISSSRVETALAQHGLDDRNPRAASVAAEQPPPGDASGAEGRAGRRHRLQRGQVAPHRRHARVLISCGPSCSPWSRRCGDCSADLLQPRRTAEVQLTLVDQGVDVAAQGRRAEGLERDRGADRLSRARTAWRGCQIDQGLGRGDALRAAAGDGHTVGRPGRVSGRRFPAGDGGRRGGAGRRGREARRRAQRDRRPVRRARHLRACVPAKALRRRGLARRRCWRCKRAAPERSPSSIATSIAGRSIADELKRFDAVVLDPPRAGAEEQVTALAASAVAAHRLCQLQSGDLRARREDAGRRRLRARLGHGRSASSAGRPMSSWPPASAASEIPAVVEDARAGVDRQAEQAQRRQSENTGSGSGRC